MQDPIFVFQLLAVEHEYIRGKITTDLGAYPSQILAEVARDYFKINQNPFVAPQIAFEINKIRAGDWLNLNNMV